MVYINVLFLLLGFLLLIKGSDFFIESSSRLAKKLGVSEFVIGLTLVAIGTSIPELSSSIAASIKGDSGLIVGSVIGSNIANIGFILGIAAIFVVINVKKLMISRDAYVVLSAAIIFYLLAFNGLISRAEGILFLLIYVSYVLFLFSSSKNDETYDFHSFLNYFMKFRYMTTIKDMTIRRFISKKKKSEKSVSQRKYYSAFKEGIVKDLLIIVLSIIAIVYGAGFLVEESIFFSELLGITTNIMGLTIVAFGTSLPELSVAIRAASKGLGDMVVGNILGSNITNILLVLGVASIINPLEIAEKSLYHTGPFMIFISLILIYIMKSKKKITRLEGIFLFLIYLIFIWSVVFL